LPTSWRLAIHPRTNSFSDRVIQLCEERGIPYQRVSAFDSGFIAKLRDFDAFLWHYDHVNPGELLAGNIVLQAAEQAGKVVFPNHATRWHFNDKIAQKYLLESIGAPLVPTWVFYAREDALAWLQEASYPVVAKLRSGSGSANVRLLRDFDQARRYAERMFGKGYASVPSYFDDMGTKMRSVRSWPDRMAKLKRLPAALKRRMQYRTLAHRENGYLLVQQFIPGNRFDTRITVVGDRAWGFIRRVRPNDFRASGSRNIDYGVENIDPQCVRIGFETAAKLGVQSVAFDFVHTPEGRPLLVEFSLGFESLPVYRVAGQWDRDLHWIEGQRYAEDFILDGMIGELEERCR
jgi:glutathione synthase/RimK-type ligase-like ATP-grasp enzyme